MVELVQMYSTSTSQYILALHALPCGRTKPILLGQAQPRCRGTSILCGQATFMDYEEI